MDLFIDSDGCSWEAGSAELENAVWDLGLLNIRQRGRTVIVALCPRLVADATLAAAFYRITDLSPELVYVIAERGDAPWERFLTMSGAFDRMHELVAAAMFDQCNSKRTVWRQPCSDLPQEVPKTPVKTANICPAWRVALGR